MLEVGKCYMVKTHALYYLGRVTKSSLLWIELENVSEVYETGELPACWGATGPTTFENYPKKETVRIPVSSIQAAPSWTKELLNK
jgi:hypothetical protein